MIEVAETVVTVTSLRVRFGMRELLNGFSIRVGSGGKITISGESGSGKSTLLKTLIGMYPPASGTITLFGAPFEPSNLPVIRRKMFYLPQDILPHGDETALEFLRYPFSLAVNRKTTFPEQRMNDLLPVLHLSTQMLDQPLNRLSGGERKRLGVLSGLLLDRPLMLLDEPTAGVDAANRDILAELLFGDAERTVIAVSHDEVVHKRSDRTVYLSNGSAEGSHGST